MALSTNLRVRLAVPSDVSSLAPLRTSLWNEPSSAEHASELQAILGGTFQSVTPLVIFVADETV
jgi:hypothetical protein